MDRGLIDLRPYFDFIIQIQNISDPADTSLLIRTLTSPVDPFFLIFLDHFIETAKEPGDREFYQELKTYAEPYVYLNAPRKWHETTDVVLKEQLTNFWFYYLIDRRTIETWQYIGAEAYHIIRKKVILHLLAINGKVEKENWIRRTYHFLGNLNAIDDIPEPMSELEKQNTGLTYLLLSRLYMELNNRDAFETGLTCLKRASGYFQKYSVHWSGCRFNLAKALTDKEKRSSEDLEEAIRILKDIARHLPVDKSFPWQIIHSTLAECYIGSVSTTETKDTYIKKAINQYGKALGMVLAEANASNIAEVARALGSAWCQLQTSRALAKGIRYLLQAAEIKKTDSITINGEETQRQLGHAYYHQARLRKNGNYRLAIDTLHQLITAALEHKRKIFENDVLIFGHACYEQSRRFRKFEEISYVEPYEIYIKLSKNTVAAFERALVEMRLGRYYFSYEFRDPTFLTRAIKLLEEAVGYFNIDNHTTEWLFAQGTLGQCYRRIGNNRDTQSQYKSIELLSEVIKPEWRSFAKVHAMIEWLTELGMALMHLEVEDRTANYESALNYFLEAFALADRVKDPLHYAIICNALGNCYKGRMKGEKASNLTKSFDYYQFGYSTPGLGKRSGVFIQLENNLASALIDLPTGNPVAHQEHALLLFERTLRRVKKNDPEDPLWYIVHGNIGMLYLKRITGKKSENLDLAIKYSQKAIKGLDPQKHAVEWAFAQQILGASFLALAKQKNSDDVGLAITHTLLALQVRKKEKFQYEFGELHHNLGVAYILQAKQHTLDLNIQTILIGLARKHFNNALNVRTHEYPFERAYTLLNYALIISDFPTFNTEEERQENFLTEMYSSIFQVFKPAVHPTHFVDASLNYANLLYHRNQYDEAIEILKKVHQVVEVWRMDTYGQLSIDGLAYKTHSMFRSLVYCLIKTGRISEAFDFLCLSKSRRFAEELSLPPADLPAIDKKVYRRVSKLWDQIEILQTQRQAIIRASDGKLNINEEKQTRRLKTKLEQAYTNYKKELNRLQGTSGALMPDIVATTTGTALEFATKIDSSIIEFYQPIEGFVAFIINKNGIRCVELPMVTSDFFIEFEHFTRKLETPIPAVLETRFEKAMLANVFDALFSPLLKYVDLSKPLLIAQAVNLSRCPIGLAFDRNKQRHLFQEAELYFIASTAIAIALHKVKASNSLNFHAESSVQIVCYPGKIDPLIHAEDEKNSLTQIFPNAKVIEHLAATPSAVVLALNEATNDIIHIICHSNYEFAQPEVSGMYLNGILTAEKIRNLIRLPNHPMVVLSSCESGIFDWGIVGELTGHNYAWLQAGASGVVSSLWSINDRSTQMLFETFYYELLNEKISVPLALRHSMTKVMNETGLGAIYFWGGFQYTGIPDSSE